LNFPANVDSLEGLPLHQERTALKSVIEHLIKAKASPAHLNFFAEIPQNPASAYLGYDTTLKLSTQHQPKSKIQEFNVQEQDKQDHKKSELLRFDRLINKPKVVSEDLAHVVKRMKPSESSPPRTITDFFKPVQTSSQEGEEVQSFSMGTRAAPPSSPLKQLVSPAKKTPSLADTAAVGFQFAAEAVASIVPPVISAYTQEIHHFSSFGASSGEPSNRLPNFNDTPSDSSKFNLPSVERNLSPQNYVGSLTTHANSFKSESRAKPGSLVGRILLNITNLYQEGTISSAQKNALKTLALQNDTGLNAAELVYEINSDRAEFVDTLQKLSHLAHAS